MIKKVDSIFVGISIGDLNGIGPEVVLKTFEDARMLELCTPIIFGNVKMLSFLKKSFESTSTLQGIDHINQAIKGKINVLNVWKESFTLNVGTEDETAGKYAIQSFVAATKALKENFIDVLVTAPINKHNIQSTEFNFPGHTDYLNKELDGNAIMLMVSQNLRVGLFTEHIPLKEVANHLTKEKVISKIDTIIQTLKQDFKINKPKVAVLGINPHTGDNGVIGQEDDLILRPAIAKLFSEGKLVFGPYAADSFFGNRLHESFDVVMASYHDQGLIPFKTLSFGNGVNFTAGLSKVRTSPDHGTAYDIAGKNKADHNSFKEAVYLAIDVFNNRTEYIELTKNPLKSKPIPS